MDVTCPFVLKIHRIVEKESRAGAHIVIIGDPDHPEVVGICGWWTWDLAANSHLSRMHWILCFRLTKAYVLCQTTFNYNKFKDLVEILSKKEV